MTILFLRSAMMRKLPDPIFEAEFDAAKEAGFECLLWAEDVLSRDGWGVAIASLPVGSGSDLLYRGWIMSEERYGEFHAALKDRGWQLVSTPKQYAEVTYVPSYYPKIVAYSPPTVWTDMPDPHQAWHVSRQLADGPFVLKDHVKSAKHLWHEACFIPQGASREQFEWIARNLLNEQGPAFHRGFVVKQFVPLHVIGESSRAYPQCEELTMSQARRTEGGAAVGRPVSRSREYQT